MNKTKNRIMILFIVLISPLLIQCDYPNRIDIQNNLNYDIKVYSRSNLPYIHFVSDNYDDVREYWKFFPEDGSLNYIIIKSGQIHKFYQVRGGSFYSTDLMYADLVNNFDDDVDYYIENMDTNEIILRRENLINNPLATFVKFGKGEWILILDEYE